MNEYLAESPLFASDVLLPSQLRSSAGDEPELTLLRAVLAGAIEDLRHVAICTGRRGCRSCHWQREARAWINGASAPLGFDVCCHALGLEPEAGAARAGTSR